MNSHSHRDAALRSTTRREFLASSTKLATVSLAYNPTSAAVAAVFQSSVRITPNDYYPHAVLREGYRERLYLDSVGKPTIGVGFNVSAKGASEVLQRMGVSDGLKGDIAAAKAWSEGPYDNKYFEGSYSIGPVVAQALYQDRVVPAINDAYAAIKNPDQVGIDRMMIVLDMRYGPGSGVFQGFQNFIAAVNAGDFDWAAFELMGTLAPNLDGPTFLNLLGENSGPHSDYVTPYAGTKWYVQTGNRGILNVQVMRGAALPKTLPDKATLRVLKDDNRAFADKWSRDQLDYSGRLQMWYWQQGHIPVGPQPTPPPPQAPPLLKQIQDQGRSSAAPGMPSRPQQQQPGLQPHSPQHQQPMPAPGQPPLPQQPQIPPYQPPPQIPPYQPPPPVQPPPQPPPQPIPIPIQVPS